MNTEAASPLGQRIRRPGHFPGPVMLESVRSLGSGYECRVRLSDGMPIRLSTNEWYKAAQLGDSYLLYVVWGPVNNPDPGSVRIQNPVKHLDHAKKEGVAAWYFDIPAEAIQTAMREGGTRS